MITKITGTLNRVLDEEVRIQVGALEYQVLVPEYVRRQVQTRIGEELTLTTFEYLEGTQMSNRMLPRIVGFLSESEFEFFDLFCTVDKVGVRKALKALARNIREIAQAIQREDAKWLSSLPGVGKATAEQIVTSLKRKVVRFTVLSDSPSEGGVSPTMVGSEAVEEAYLALLSLGLSPMDARTRIDVVLHSGKEFNNAQDLITLAFKTD